VLLSLFLHTLLAFEPILKVWSADPSVRIVEALRFALCNGCTKQATVSFLCR